MKPISIQYRITESEFMSAWNAHWTAHHQGTVSNLITGMVCIVIGFALYTFMNWFAIFVAIAGTVLLLITYARSVILKRSFRNAKKYNSKISVTFSEDVVHVETAEGKSELNWSFFSWYRDTSDHVLLYMTKRSFSVIPKAAFQDERDTEEFKDIVESKLEKIR